MLAPAWARAEVQGSARAEVRGGSIGGSIGAQQDFVDVVLAPAVGIEERVGPVRAQAHASSSLAGRFDAVGLSPLVSQAADAAVAFGRAESDLATELGVRASNGQQAFADASLPAGQVLGLGQLAGALSLFDAAVFGRGRRILQPRWHLTVDVELRATVIRTPQPGAEFSLAAALFPLLADERELDRQFLPRGSVFLDHELTRRHRVGLLVSGEGAARADAVDAEGNATGGGYGAGLVALRSGHLLTPRTLAALTAGLQLGAGLNGALIANPWLDARLSTERRIGPVVVTGTGNAALAPLYDPFSGLLTQRLLGEVGAGASLGAWSTDANVFASTLVSQVETAAPVVGLVDDHVVVGRTRVAYSPWTWLTVDAGASASARGEGNLTAVRDHAWDVLVFVGLEGRFRTR